MDRCGTKGLSVVGILAIFAVVIVAGGVLAFVYVTNNTNPKLDSSAYTPATIDVQVPQSDSDIGFKPSEKASSSTTSTKPAPTTPPPPSTQTIPIGQIYTSTLLSADKKTFTVDFKSSTSFKSITTIDYGLTYDSNGVSRAVQGTITVASSTIATDAQNNQYIRKDIALGTCSGTSCVYDENPKAFHLSVSTR